MRRIFGVEREQAVEVASREACQPALGDRARHRGIALVGLARAGRGVEARLAKHAAHLDLIALVIAIAAALLRRTMFGVVAPCGEVRGGVELDDRDALAV